MGTISEERAQHIYQHSCMEGSCPYHRNFVDMASESPDTETRANGVALCRHCGYHEYTPLAKKESISIEQHSIVGIIPFFC